MLKKYSMLEKYNMSKIKYVDMILSMLKIQHVEQYSMLKSQYSMLKAKGIQHVERNTAC